METSLHSVVRETWLTRRLNPSAAIASAWITLALILAAALAWNDKLGLGRQMTASHAQVWQSHEWWRAWSTLLVHADIRHLLSNAFLFYILGVFLIGYFGRFVFPTLAFVAGGLVNLLVLRQMPADTELIGASGVVYWMAGFWLTLYFLIDRRRSVSQRALRAGGVALGVFMPTEAFDPSVSYMSHLWGFAFGVIMAMIYFQRRRLRFRSAEVREWVFEDEPDLTPPHL